MLRHIYCSISPKALYDFSGLSYCAWEMHIDLIKSSWMFSFLHLPTFLLKCEKGIPHFIVLPFIMLHRCCTFKNWRLNLPPAKRLGFTLLGCSLYGGGLGLNPQYLRGLPAFRSQHSSPRVVRLLQDTVKQLHNLLQSLPSRDCFSSNCFSCTVGIIVTSLKLL